VELTPEEAFERRVKARLGSAIRDNAKVFIATDRSEADESIPAILGTVDCIPLEAGQYRRALAPELPARIMIRNLWVDPARRREGIARKLMEAAEEYTSDRGVRLLTLEVLSNNAPAIGLYYQRGFYEIDAPPVPLPNWLRGTLMLAKDIT